VNEKLLLSAIGRAAAGILFYFRMSDLKGLYIEGTGRTPRIEFTSLTGELVLNGRSVPENAAKIYEPFLEWVNEYVKSPCAVTNLHLKLEYFNSSSLIWIVKLITAMGNIKLRGALLYIHFYFEIEDYEGGISDELKDLIEVLADKIKGVKFHIAFKTHGIDSNGNTVRESTILV
jgi:hypothetical protein